MAPAAGASWKKGSSRCQGRRSSSAHPNRAASDRSSSRFHSVKGRSVARSTSANVANRRSSSSSPVCSAEREVVAVAEVARRLVPQASELSDVGGDFRPDLLGRVPRRPPLGDVVAGAQDLGDHVVVDAATVDLTPKVVEGGLHARLELDDGAPLFGRHLLGHEGVVEDVEPPAEERVGAGCGGVSRGADLGEQLRVGEQGAAGELGVDAAPVGLGRRLGVRLPPRLGQLELERPQASLDRFDELDGAAHARRSLRSRIAHVSRAASTARA